MQVFCACFMTFEHIIWGDTELHEAHNGEETCGLSLCIKCFQHNIVPFDYTSCSEEIAIGILSCFFFPGSCAYLCNIVVALGWYYQSTQVHTKNLHLRCCCFTRTFFHSIYFCMLPQLSRERSSFIAPDWIILIVLITCNLLVEFTLLSPPANHFVEIMIMLSSWPG